MSLGIGLLCLLGPFHPQQVPDHITFGPIEADPMAVAAHRRLFAGKPLIEFIEASGSDPRIKTSTVFVSDALAERLSKCNWPTRSPSFKFAPAFGDKDARFDLADAYAYCFIANMDLAFPDVDDKRYTLRPWPVEKIRRQFGRALTVAGPLSLDEKERLYYALARSGAVAQEWWYEIEMAINVRGDVIGNSHADADFLVQWLVGAGVQGLESKSVKAGVQRTRKQLTSSCPKSRRSQSLLARLDRHR